MGGRAIEIILMRQLASYLAVPILIVDRKQDLLFFNESAEPSGAGYSGRATRTACSSRARSRPCGSPSIATSPRTAASGSPGSTASRG